MYAGQELRADRFDTSCQFSRVENDGVDGLSISITTMQKIDQEFQALLVRCGSNRTALKGIGNEGYECAKAGSDRNAQLMFVGRIRNRAFVIEIAEAILKPNAAQQKKLSDELEFAAEQVSGNLF